MVREIVKLAVAAAIIVIAGGLIALFASGYISAFKPGGTKDAAGEHVIGGSNTIGGGSVAGLVTPSPAPQPGPGMPETVQMPPGPEPAIPTIQPVQPPLTPQVPMAPGAQQNPYMPVTQPSWPPEGPGQYPGPDSRIIRDRPTPIPMAPPAMQPPSQGETPGSAWPIALLPGQGGWMQVSDWLLRLVPVLFPGLFPGWTWWS